MSEVSFARIDFATMIATRGPIEEQFANYPAEFLPDLSPWGVTDHAYYPIDTSSWAELAEYQAYDMPTEVLVVDAALKVVYSTVSVRPWTAEEIEADLAPKRVAAIYNLSRDVDGFHNACINQRREREQPVLDAAKAFAAVGYTGDTPEVVTAMMNEHADSAMTAQEAADAIIAKFDNIDGVLGQVFAKRTKVLAAIHASMVNADLNAATSEWNAFFTGLCDTLRIVPRYDY